ncbi:excinuclease ABC subunit UvrC [Clostridium algidicarnis]|uniref:excinuclease ABC subunit UvrC n=1 Tax=Clostridium algidicarnis TaxID=37659 RepID=UPI0004951E97|nr:excinuclease ABC subunit UvrC [Clostridium algidicarnis]
MFDFEYQLKILPDKPGVYIMKNSLGEVLYVGKAKILKNRVRQYFQSSKNHSEKVKAMVRHVAEFEYIVTDSEMEALILECNLIKKYKPKYNILLKDDKHYPFIKITTNEEFPRVFVTRSMAKDGNKYFGPYTDVSAVYETIELIQKIFPIRNCKLTIKEDGIKYRPCLNYQIKLCTGPCAGYISKEDYKKLIDDIIDLLNGKNSKIVQQLKSEMDIAAEELKFEKAASARDKMLAVEKIAEKQKIFLGHFENEDFINMYGDEKDTCMQIFFFREGKLIGREHFMLEDTAGFKDSEIVSQFIKSFYGGTAHIPKSIYVPEIEDGELLEEWLSIKRGSKVELKIPQKGEKKRLLDMVEKNAKLTLEQFKFKILRDKEIHKIALTEFADLLNLDYIPHRIESYDISNIQGMDSVGSMIVFEDGRAKNSDYRRFKINTVKGANDYESMKEILTRRFNRGLSEVKSIQERNIKLNEGKFHVFPEIIMMDGGKGQVNIALDVLKDLNINIPVCGMVKDDNHKTRGLIFNNEELIIPMSSNVMQLITRMQDEVHRFAITYHRTLRDKRILHSILDDIPNIGDKRRKELLKKFKGIDNIKNATYEELIETPSIDKRAAMSIIEFFKNQK